MVPNPGETRVDAIIRRFKNQPVAAWGILLLVGIIGLGEVTGALESIAGFFHHGAARSDTASRRAANTVITGTWERYDSISGLIWQRTTRILITKEEQTYIIASLSTFDSSLNPSRGIFDVRFDGKRLLFKSLWGPVDTGQFDLQLVAANILEGRAYWLNRPSLDPAHIKYYRVQ